MVIMYNYAKTKLLYITGPDGAGKTTQAKLLLNRLKRKGINCEYRWLRRPYFFSFTVLYLARLFDLSKVKNLEGKKKIGYHYFYKYKPISLMYQVLLLIDSLISSLIMIFIPIKLCKKMIVCDRFIFDILVDLMISINNYSLYKTKIGELFLRLLPRNSKIVMLMADEIVLRNRKIDVMQDKTLSARIDLYNRMANEFSIPIIDASLSIKEIHACLLELINMEL